MICATDHTTTNTYYPIKDHQNTVLALADENGDIVETYDLAGNRLSKIEDGLAATYMLGTGNRLNGLPQLLV